MFFLAFLLEIWLRLDDQIDFTHEPSICSLEGRCDVLKEDVVKIDSRDVVDVSIIEYRAKDFGFS